MDVHENAALCWKGCSVRFHLVSNERAVLALCVKVIGSHCLTASVLQWIMPRLFLIILNVVVDESACSHLAYYHEVETDPVSLIVQR